MFNPTLISNDDFQKFDQHTEGQWLIHGAKLFYKDYFISQLIKYVMSFIIYSELTTLTVLKSYKDMFSNFPAGASKNQGQSMPPHPDDCDPWFEINPLLSVKLILSPEFWQQAPSGTMTERDNMDIMKFDWRILTKIYVKAIHSNCTLIVWLANDLHYMWGYLQYRLKDLKVMRVGKLWPLQKSIN